MKTRLQSSFLVRNPKNIYWDLNELTSFMATCSFIETDIIILFTKVFFSHYLSLLNDLKKHFLKKLNGSWMQLIKTRLKNFKLISSLSLC